MHQPIIKPNLTYTSLLKPMLTVLHSLNFEMLHHLTDIQTDELVAILWPIHRSTVHHKN